MTMTQDLPSLKKKNFHAYPTIAMLVIAGLLIVLFSSGMSLNIGALFGGKLSIFFASETIQLLLLFLVFVLTILGWIKVRLYVMSDVFWLLFPTILTVLALVAMSIQVQYSNNNENVQTVVHVFIVYFLICFFKETNINFNRAIVANFIVIVGFFEAILGIYQHISKNTIFDPQQLNAIYFLNGSSSSNINELGFAANVRAFGTFDSGLTLGVFLIFSIAIMLDLSSLKKWMKFLVFLVYLFAIYTTLTRNVYIGLGVFILCYFFARSKVNFIYKRWIYIISILISASLFWLSDLLNFLVSIASSINISTFGSRFLFLQQIINEIPDSMHFFFGSGITSSSGIPIDSSAMTLVAQFGLVFTFFVFLLQISIFNAVFSDDSPKMPALGAFLFLFPIIGASNNVIQSFLIAFALIFIFKNAEEVQI